MSRVEESQTASHNTLYRCDESSERVAVSVTQHIISLWWVEWKSRSQTSQRRTTHYIFVMSRVEESQTASHNTLYRCDESSGRVAVRLVSVEQHIISLWWDEWKSRSQRHTTHYIVVMSRVKESQSASHNTLYRCDESSGRVAVRLVSVEQHIISLWWAEWKSRSQRQTTHYIVVMSRVEESQSD